MNRASIRALLSDLVTRVLITGANGFVARDLAEGMARTERWLRSAGLLPGEADGRSSRTKT